MRAEFGPIPLLLRREEDQPIFIHQVAEVDPVTIVDLDAMKPPHVPARGRPKVIAFQVPSAVPTPIPDPVHGGCGHRSLSVTADIYTVIVGCATILAGGSDLVGLWATEKARSTRTRGSDLARWRH